MNQIYRVVFNTLTGAWQAVSEIARGRSKSSRSSSNAALGTLCGLLLGFTALPAQAVCSMAASIVTCNGAANPLAPSYTNSGNGLSVTVNPGASLGTLLGVGGTSLSLMGSNVSLRNTGTISPSLLGHLSIQSTAVLVGNTASSSMVSITNEIGGLISGTGALLGGSLYNLTGMALDVRNATGGTTTISNAGTISSNALAALSLRSEDTPVVAVTGGSTVNMTNTGTIIGRVAFEASSTGNTFTNAGTVDGSVSLGAGGGDNQFVAVTGSSVSAGSGVGTALNVTSNPLLSFAAAGIVDGGSASNNSLVLQNSTSGPGSGRGGALTTLAWNQYINFQKLTVNSGTWNLQGGWTGTGTTTLNDGLVNFNHAGAFGSGQVTVNGGAIAASGAGLTLGNNFNLNAGLILDGTLGFGLNGVLQGSGGLIINNTGVVTLAGANLFAGGVNLNTGGLVLGNAGALGSGNLTVGGSASLDTTAAFNLANNLVVNSGSTLSLLGSNALSLSGSISGTGNLVKNGTSTLTLNGANSLTGSFTISGGSVALGAGGSLSPTGAITMGAGTSLDLSAAANQTIGSLAGLGGTVNLGIHTLTLGGLGNTSYAGTIAGTGGLIKLGTGVQTLSGNNTFSGGVALNAGGLLLGNAGALGTGALFVGGSATLDGTSGLALANAVNLGSGTSLNLLGNQALTLNGVIGGTGGLLKNGATTLTLNGANTFAGGIALDAGGLMLGNGSALGTGALNVGGAVTLDANSALSVGNSINLGTGSSLNVLGGQPLALGGVIAGNGGLMKSGASTLTLTGANTYTGGTAIHAGTLAIGSGGRLAATGAVYLIGAGATLDISLGGDQTVGALSGGTGTTVVLGSSTLTFGDATNQTLVGTISGSGGLVKQGAGTQTLIAANTYTGSTTVSGGTLALVSSGSLSASTALNVGVGATFDISAKSSTQTVGSLAGAGTLKLGSNSLNIGADHSSTTFSGSIDGTGGLTKTGTGTLTLAGGNNFSGYTAVNGGGLVMASGSSLASSQVTVASGASLGGSGSLSGHVTVTSGATLAPGASNGTGSLTVGSLDMAQGSTLAVALGAPGANFQTPGQGTSVSVTGNLTLNGMTLSMTDAGGFGPGLYRLFDYGGTLTMSNGGFAAIPTSATIQFLTADKKINLINTQGLMLNLWNANGQASSTAMGGGSGTWSNTAAAWTDATGSITAAMSPQPGFAIFGGASGTVTLDSAAGAVKATGLQFASDGYRLNGDALTLVADAGHAVPVEVRVGDGSGQSSTWTATMDNVLAGTDGLKKTGAGTLVLNGNNIYSGGTTVAAGTLSVSSDHNLGSSADALTLDGGAVQVTGTAFTGNGGRSWVLGSTGGGIDIADAANSFTLSSALTGTGNLLKTGAGTLTLTGANNYSGTTTIDGGKLVASAANLGSGAITNNAALELNQASDATLTQTISGHGSFTKTGAGKLTLAGVNTSTGTTVISAGTLVASVASLGSGAITNNAALELHQASDGNLNQIISGTGSLTKTGTGALNLSSANTYSGGTTIGGGTLVAANAGALGTGDVTVGNGAALEVTSGTTLLVGGDLTFQAGSTYRVQADPVSLTSSKISVDGTATLGGSVLHVGPQTDAATDFQVGKTYTILHASQINGSFSAATSNYAYLDAALGYQQTNGATTDVTLKLQRKSSSTGGGDMGFAELAETRNQSSTANAISSLPSTSALYQFVEKLPAGAPATVLASLSGDTHGSVGGSLVGLGAFAPSVSGQHLRNNITAGFRAGAPVAQSDGPLPASAWPSSKALPAWAEVVGHWQRYDGDGNAAQLKQRTSGLFLGMDQEVGTSGWRLGGSLGYTQADGKVADRSSESDVNSYSAAVYGGKSFGTGTGPRINVLGGLAYTWHDIETTRRVSSLGQTLKADYSAHTAQLFAEVGYAIGQYDKVGFEPFAAVSLGQQRTGSFQERGGFAALKGRSSTDDLASTTLGLRVHSDFQLAGKEGRLRATVGWRHAFGDVTAKKTMAFEGGQNFTVAGTPLARNTAVLGLEADVALSRSAALVLGYQGEMGSGQRDHSASVKLRWAF